MIYSVYEPDRKLYSYYEGPGPSGTHALPPKARRRTPLGYAPDDASWTLPLAATKIGEGELPRGRIASISRATPLGIDISDPVDMGVVAGLVYLAWRVLR